MQVSKKGQCLHPGVGGGVRCGRLLKQLLAAGTGERRVCLIGRQRVYELGHHHEIPAQHEDGARIVCRPTVIGRGEKGDEVALGKALKAVHHTLVRPHNHLQVVGLHDASHRGQGPKKG